MHRLVPAKRAAKVLGHHEAMLQDVARLGSHLGSEGVFRWHPNQDVPSTVVRAAPFPQTVPSTAYPERVA